MGTLLYKLVWIGAIVLCLLSILAYSECVDESGNVIDCATIEDDLSRFSGFHGSPTPILEQDKGSNKPTGHQAKHAGKTSHSSHRGSTVPNSDSKSHSGGKPDGSISTHTDGGRIPSHPRPRDMTSSNSRNSNGKSKGKQQPDPHHQHNHDWSWDSDQGSGIISALPGSGGRLPPVHSSAPASVSHHQKPGKPHINGSWLRRHGGPIPKNPMGPKRGGIGVDTEGGGNPPRINAARSSTLKGAQAPQLPSPHFDGPNGPWRHEDSGIWNGPVRGGGRLPPHPGASPNHEQPQDDKHGGRHHGGQQRHHGDGSKEKNGEDNHDTQHGNGPQGPPREPPQGPPRFGEPRGLPHFGEHQGSHSGEPKHGSGQEPEGGTQLDNEHQGPAPHGGTRGKPQGGKSKYQPRSGKPQRFGKGNPGPGGKSQFGEGKPQRQPHNGGH